MDGDQWIGGPGRPSAQQGRQGRQGSPFPGADPDATHAYPGPFGAGPGGAGGAQYGAGQAPTSQYRSGQYGADQYGADQYGADQYGGRQYAADQYGADQYGPSEQGPGQFGPGRFGPGQFGPGQYGPDDAGPGGSGGPSRRVVLISLGVAAALAVGAGTIYGLTRPNATTTASTTPSVSLTPPAATTPSAGAATPVKTVTVTTTPSGSATATVAGTMPTGYVSDPWSNPGMEFGTLVSVKKQGAGAVISVRRQQFLTGAAAQQYYAAHPGEEVLDYKIVDLGKTRTITVAPDAMVYGQYLLGDQNQVATSQLTVAQFVAKAKDLQSKSLPLHLWLYQRSTTSGPAVYLAEQYTP